MGNDLRCLATDIICGFEPKSEDDIPKKLPHLRHPSASDSAVFKYSKKSKRHSTTNNEVNDEISLPNKLTSSNSSGKLEMETKRKKTKREENLDTIESESKRYSANHLMSPMLSQSQFHSIINVENKKEYKLV